MTPAHITFTALILALAIILRRPLFIRPVELLLGWLFARHFRNRRRSQQGKTTRFLLQDGAQCLAYSRALKQQRRHLATTLPAITQEDRI